jgi:hypothetical protein
MKNHVETYIEQQMGDNSDIAPITHDDSRDREQEQRTNKNAYPDPESPLDYPDNNYDQDIDPEPDTPEPEPEPEPEPCPEDPYDPEPEQERRPRLKNDQRSRADQRIREAISERQKAIDIANRLAEENEQLRQMASQSSEAVNLFREDSIEHRRELVKKKLLEARENGDLQLEVDANFEMGLIAAELKDVQKQKIENEYWQRKNQEDQQRAAHIQQQQQYAQPNHPPREALEWMDKNPWFNKNHPEYDRELAEEVSIYSDGLEEKYKRAGLSHQILGQNYLNEINRFVNKTRGEINNQGQRRQIPMKTSRTPVSQARGNAGRPAPKGKPGESLTPAQKGLAESMGITYAKMEQYVMEDRKEQAAKGYGQYM